MRLLIDENLAHLFRDQLRSRLRGSDVRAIGDPETPPRGTLDLVVLAWCEENDFVLVTGDRASMPDQFAEHLARGRHLPGVLVVRPRTTLGAVLDTLELIVSAALSDELRDLYLYIPL